MRMKLLFLLPFSCTDRAALALPSLCLRHSLGMGECEREQ